MHPLMEAVQATELIQRMGRVTAVRGQTVESQGPAAQVGEHLPDLAIRGARRRE